MRGTRYGWFLKTPGTHEDRARRVLGEITRDVEAMPVTIDPYVGRKFALASQAAAEATMVLGLPMGAPVDPWAGQDPEVLAR